MLTIGAQIVAARALLGIDQITLSALCGISVTTIKKMEKTARGPIEGKISTLRAVQQALEAKGVEFLNHGRPGVQMKEKGK